MITRLRSVLPVLLAVCSFAPGRAAAPAEDAASNRPKPRAESASPSGPVVRFDEFLWRRVENRQGEQLGTVSDVLVNLPSGRIVYLAVVPADLYGRPKAVPPGVLTVSPDPREPLVLDMTTERWITAPVLDWNEALVIKLTEEGSKIYGFYQQRWIEPPPGLTWSMNVVVPEQERSELARYVSLKKLEHERLLAQDRRQVGYVHDFLLDWGGQRVTHALVSPEPAAIGLAEETWFAVPVGLLQRSTEYDALSLDREPEAFAQAAPAPEGVGILNANTDRVYRYPAELRANWRIAE